MSRYHIERIIEFSKTLNRHRKWSEFCLQEGLTKDAVWHQRKKLGLPMRRADSIRQTTV